MTAPSPSTLDETVVHPFDSGVTDPRVVGGKGSSLARMSGLGVPVPPGFTIGTGAWRARRAGRVDEADLRAEVSAALAAMERVTGRRLGDPADPLLVSVRSGAPVSMPGMMDTVLNVGLTPGVADALAERGGCAFADALVARLQACFADIVGVPLPADPRAQLDEAIAAVWRSWDAPRARRYRRFRGIGEDLGTAVTIQTMVFGNLDERSGTGVAFTRDPATGAPGAYGDFLLRAQGEDVVAGGCTPEPLASAAEYLPEAFDALSRTLPVLEGAYRDLCDVEFTVEAGRLWVLQARVGQRSSAAAVRIAVDLVAEGVIDRDEALRRVPACALADLRRPVRVADASLPVLGRGLAASPGTAVGVAAFDPERAEALADAGHDVVLVRPETSPEDVGGMIAAAGIVTAAGGRASHAAVVARGLGRPAVCGVDGLTVDAHGATFPSGDRVREGDPLTVDGATGEVFAGAAELAVPAPGPAARQLLDWCAAASVPVLDAAPGAAVRCTGPDDLPTDTDRPVAVDVEWEGAASAAVLDRTCAALQERGHDHLYLVVPADLRGADLSPPPGPWRGIVAPPGVEWAALLVAARLARSADRAGAPAQAAS
ncbi:pyruvate, phosphate dikinase [Pseudonocardia sp. RS010]|uniref:pyruvate, phosphate dikinase n=1 Tax=Pseudonocardia sp. RS010 TaxID=3385979 RepID=UPI0039A1419D